MDIKTAATRHIPDVLKSRSSILLFCLKIFSVLSTLLLLFYYRAGGIADTGRLKVGLRDLGPFVEGGKAIISGINPYDPVITRGGSAGSLAIGILSILIPQGLVMISFQALNFLGLFYFIRKFPIQLALETRYIIFLIAIWSAPFRENLSLNQITGIVLGLITLGFLTEFRKNRVLKIVISRLSIGLAVDLKPQIVVPIIFIFFIFKYFRREILEAGTTLLTIHLIIDLRIGEIIEKDYIHFLSTLAKQSKGSDFGDSVTYWPLLQDLGINLRGIFVGTISMIVVGFLIYKLTAIKNPASILAMSLIVPTFGSYFHLYDAIGVATVALIYFAKESRLLLPTIIFGCLIMIPIELNSIQNFLIEIFGVSLIAFLALSSYKPIEVITKSAVGLLAGFLLNYINHNLSGTARSMQIIVTTEIVAIATIILVIFLRKQRASNVL
jgi:hypothetical protein